MAQRLIGNPPPLELAQSDPAGYLYAKEAYEARVRDLQALNAHTGELTRSQQQQRQQAQQQALLEEAQRTVKVLPQLADPAKRTAFLESAVQAASASGFTPEDVASVTDHRMLHLLDRLVKAERRLSALDGASKSVKSKLADVAPKPLRAGNAGTQSQGQMNKASRAREMFMKSGRTMKDVQRYLEVLDS
jgi:cell pole-organizing protein PopZ